MCFFPTATFFFVVLPEVALFALALELFGLASADVVPALDTGFLACVAGGVVVDVCATSPFTTGDILIPNKMATTIAGQTLPPMVTIVPLFSPTHIFHSKLPRCPFAAPIEHEPPQILHTMRPS